MHSPDPEHSYSDDDRARACDELLRAVCRVIARTDVVAEVCERVARYLENTPAPVGASDPYDLAAKTEAAVDVADSLYRLGNLARLAAVGAAKCGELSEVLLTPH